VAQETNIPTDEQANAMREQLSRYERQKAYEAAMARNALYLALKPLVESDDFIALHQQITDLRDNGPKDDMFFGIGLEAIYNGMTNLDIQCANWQEPVDPNAPVVTPTPAVEGTNDGN
jgi:hypothetical protein